MKSHGWDMKGSLSNMRFFKQNTQKDAHCLYLDYDGQSLTIFLFEKNIWT